MAPPLKSLYILKNNCTCTKFGAFVCFAPISSKFTTKQLDNNNYYNNIIQLYLSDHVAHDGDFPTEQSWYG